MHGTWYINKYNVSQRTSISYHILSYINHEVFSAHIISGCCRRRHPQGIRRPHRLCRQLWSSGWSRPFRRCCEGPAHRRVQSLPPRHYHTRSKVSQSHNWYRGSVADLVELSTLPSQSQLMQVLALVKPVTWLHVLASEQLRSLLRHLPQLSPQLSPFEIFWEGTGSQWWQDWNK